MHRPSSISRRGVAGARWITTLAVGVWAALVLLPTSAGARVKATRVLGAGSSATAISTGQFVNQFDTEPYVGNGYFSQRIPAAGMGLLTGLGTIGWPLGTPRYTEALATGVYAKTNASVGFYPPRPSR